MFADLDALTRNDAAQEPVIVAPTTRRTDRSLLQCPRDATGCRRTREGPMLQHDEETFRTVRANKLERLQGRQKGCAAWHRRGARQKHRHREGGSEVQSRGMAPVRGAAAMTGRKGEISRAALLAPRHQRTVSRRPRHAVQGEGQIALLGKCFLSGSALDPVAFDYIGDRHYRRYSLFGRPLRRGPH